MSERIKTFSDGSYLEYDFGKFDNWCVYLYRPNYDQRIAPRDIDYFSHIKSLSEKYTSQKIYDDFVKIYDKVSNKPKSEDLYLISEISKSYSNDIDNIIDIDILYSILYMAMISEERKENTRLGKRIKRLGIYYLLFENYSVQDAANFMRGKGWKEIDRLCKERKF